MSFGGKGRTRLTVLRCTYRDVIAIIIIAAFITGIVLINVYAPGYRM